MCIYPAMVRAADYTGRFFLVDDTSGALLKVNATSGKIAWTKRGLGGPLAIDRGRTFVAAGTDLVSVTAGGRFVWWRPPTSAQRPR